MPADDVRSIKAYVRTPPGVIRAASTDFSFVLTDTGSATTVRYATMFRGPE